MSSYFTSGSDGIGRSSDLHGAKVQIYFGLSKKNALLLAFFSLEDAASRYCLEAIGWGLPEFDSGQMDKEAWIASARMRMRCPMTTVLGKEETFLGL